MTNRAELFDQTYEAIDAIPWQYPPYTGVDLGEAGYLTLKVIHRDDEIDRQRRIILREVGFTSRWEDADEKVIRIQSHKVIEVEGGGLKAFASTDGNWLPIAPENNEIAIISFLSLAKATAEARLQEIKTTGK